MAMATMTESIIQNTVSDYLSILTDLAPHLQPNIYPSYLPVLTPSSLFVTASQQDELKRWLTLINLDLDELLLQTSVDYENRKVIIQKLLRIEDIEQRELYSVPGIIQLMIDGNKNYTKKLKEKFLLANGYDDVGEYEHVFNEVYQVAYSLRVILSNVPGFVVELDGKCLPYEDGAELITALEKISNLHRNKSSTLDDDEDEEDVTLESITKSNKKRKHKRSRK